MVLSRVFLSAVLTNAFVTVIFILRITGDREAISDEKNGERDDDDDDEDEGDDDIDEQKDDKDDELASATHARPRRLSELRTPDRVKPIPVSSSLFLFSPTNRCV